MFAIPRGSHAAAFIRSRAAAHPRNKRAARCRSRFDSCRPRRSRRRPGNIPGRRCPGGRYWACRTNHDARLVAWASRPLGRGHPARAFPAGAGRSRDSGRDAHVTSRGMTILAVTSHGQDALTDVSGLTFVSRSPEEVNGRDTVLFALAPKRAQLSVCLADANLPAVAGCKQIERSAKVSTVSGGLPTPKRIISMDNPTHFHHHCSSPSNVHAHEAHPSRRDFLRVLMGGALAGASILELAYHRAAWARAATDPAPSSSTSRRPQRAFTSRRLGRKR